MAKKLAGEVAEVNEALAAAGVSHKLSEVKYADGLVEVKSVGSWLQVVYFQVDAYPASPAMLMCNDDEQLNGHLQALNEQFEEYAVLSDVLRAICTALKFESDLLILEQLDASMAEAHEDGDYDNASDGTASDVVGFYDMGDGDNEELMREVLQKTSRWTKLERERVQAEDERKAQVEQNAAGSSGRAEARTYLEGVASRNQIFNIQEAFAMLSRELSDMMKDTALPFTMDAVENDAYHWEIAFSKFDSSSPLAQDLRQLAQEHGQCEIVLRMEFKRGLHPFFPPSIQLVRPRCRAPLIGALSSHPMLQLAHWDPWRPQKDLIEQLQLFLQAHARIAIESPLNAPGTESAYSRLERLLAKLEALTGVLPACYQRYEAVYSGRDSGVDEQHLLALAPSNKRPKTADGQARANVALRHALSSTGTGKQSWAAGTGYGSGGSSRGPIWDAQKAKLAQDAQDAELNSVFASLATAMAPTQTCSSSAQAALEQPELDEAGVSNEEAASAIRDSCLVPFMEAELGQASFTDMGNRSQYYMNLLQVVSRLATPQHAALLFTSQAPAACTERRRTVFEDLCNLQRQADHFLSVLRVSRSNVTPNRSFPMDMQHADEESIVRHMAELIVNIHRHARDLEPEQKDKAAAAESEGAAAGSDTAYVAAMRPMQLGFLEGIVGDHKYRGKAGAEGVRPRPRTVRLGKEIAGLNNDLPLSPTSSVFVRVDQQSVTLWRALITGPAGTPYSGGCFIFDIYFQPDYPSGGSVRFGPNLYNCGKVCLSLLGTWSGGKGEGWDSAVSTTLQVLVSIQSLIFVDEPYYCEPGYEAQMHTDAGNRASKAYNLSIREHTMHWAIWQQMKSPPKGFEEIVREHFRQRKTHVLETCQQWVDEAVADKVINAARMAKFLKDIKAELAKL